MMETFASEPLKESGRRYMILLGSSKAREGFVRVRARRALLTRMAVGVVWSAVLSHLGYEVALLGSWGVVRAGWWGGAGLC